jgi:hypothetical protein
MNATRMMRLRLWFLRSLKLVGDRKLSERPLKRLAGKGAICQFIVAPDSNLNRLANACKGVWGD